MEKYLRKKYWQKIMTLNAIMLTTCGTTVWSIISTSHTKDLYELRNNKNFMKTKGKYCNDISNESVITSVQINDHKKAISDKLQLELKAAYVDANTIAQTVGTFEANVDNFQSEVDGIQEGLDQKYAYVNEQANILGIEVMDFDNFQNYTIPTVNTMYAQDLLKAGVDLKTAQEKANSISQLELNLLANAQAQLYTPLEISLELAAITAANRGLDLATMKSDNSQLLTSDEIVTKTNNAQLHVVLNYLLGCINKTLLVNDDGTFPSLLKDYSASGKYDIDSIIDEKDLQKLFSFTYDTVYGTDLTQFELENLPATASGEYDKVAINSLVNKAPLGTYQNSGSSYEIGDIIPGYQLRARIVQIDDTTDSHKCNLQLKFGISKDNAPSDIVWEDDDMMLNAEDDVHNIVLSVNSNDDREYIAQNKYYVNPGAAIIDGDYTADKDGCWFSKTMNQRNNIDIVLQNAYVSPESGEYDFDNHQMFLIDENDIAGIPKPENLNLKGVFHNNQRLQVRVKYANTGVSPTGDDLSYLSLNYCYVDDNHDVRDVAWNINGHLYDAINVRYDLSQDIKDDISKANSFLDICNNLKTSMDDMNKIDDNEMNGFDKVNQSKLILNSTESATAFGLALLVPAFTAAAWGTMGSTTALLVTCIGALTLNVALGTMMTITTVRGNNDFHNFKNLRTELKKQDLQKAINDAYYQMSGDLQKHIRDPLYAIPLKDADCKKVLEIQHNIASTGIFDKITAVCGKNANLDKDGVEQIIKVMRGEAATPALTYVADSFVGLSTIGTVGLMRSYVANKYITQNFLDWIEDWCGRRRDVSVGFDKFKYDRIEIRWINRAREQNMMLPSEDIIRSRTYTYDTKAEFVLQILVVAVTAILIVEEAIKNIINMN